LTPILSLALSLRLSAWVFLLVLPTSFNIRLIA